MVRVKYQLPVNIVGDNLEWLEELQKPLNVTVYEIQKDLNKFVKGFPVDRIPHMTEEEAKQVQNFTSPRKNKERAEAKKSQTAKTPTKPLIPQKTDQVNLHFLKSVLTESHIEMTFDEIRSDRVAKLIGLCSHFVYWSVLGNFNSLPLDDYHMKQLFISMLQCVSSIEIKFLKNEKMKTMFVNFVMPMIILTIRVEMEVIFKMNYRAFLANKS